MDNTDNVVPLQPKPQKAPDNGVKYFTEAELRQLLLALRADDHTISDEEAGLLFDWACFIKFQHTLLTLMLEGQLRVNNVRTELVQAIDFGIDVPR